MQPANARSEHPRHITDLRLDHYCLSFPSPSSPGTALHTATETSVYDLVKTTATARIQRTHTSAWHPDLPARATPPLQRWPTWVSHAAEPISPLRTCLPPPPCRILTSRGALSHPPSIDSPRTLTHADNPLIDQFRSATHLPNRLCVPLLPPSRSLSPPSPTPRQDPTATARPPVCGHWSGEVARGRAAMRTGGLINPTTM